MGAQLTTLINTAAAQRPQPQPNNQNNANTNNNTTNNTTNNTSNNTLPNPLKVQHSYHPPVSKEPDNVVVEKFRSLLGRTPQRSERDIQESFKSILVRPKPPINSSVLTIIISCIVVFIIFGVVAYYYINKKNTISPKAAMKASMKNSKPLE